jgi:hypothetical protein
MRILEHEILAIAKCLRFLQFSFLSIKTRFAFDNGKYVGDVIYACFTCFVWLSINVLLSSISVREFKISYVAFLSKISTIMPLPRAQWSPICM